MTHVSGPEPWIFSYSNTHPFKDLIRKNPAYQGKPPEIHDMVVPGPRICVTPEEKFMNIHQTPDCKGIGLTGFLFKNKSNLLIHCFFEAC